MNSFLKGATLGVGAVFGVGLGVAVAFVLPSGSFQRAEPISSDAVNANFAAIAAELNAAQERLNALDGRKRVYTAPNGTTYSLDGSYCGKTAALNGAEVGGLTGAKVRCEAVCSPSAHMCTGEELTRLLATDLAFAQSSMPSTVWFQSFDDDGGTSGTCNGWTSNSHDVHATCLENHARFSWNYCDRRCMLGVEGRLALVEEIWASICADAQRFPLSGSQLAELERRIADDDQFPDDVVPWNEVKSSVQARLGR